MSIIHQLLRRKKKYAEFSAEMIWSLNWDWFVQKCNLPCSFWGKGCCLKCVVFSTFKIFDSIDYSKYFTFRLWMLIISYHMVVAERLHHFLCPRDEWRIMEVAHSTIIGNNIHEHDSSTQRIFANHLIYSWTILLCKITAECILEFIR